MRNTEQIISRGIPIYSSGYAVKISEVATSRPGKTIVRRRPVERVGGHLLVQAFNTSHDVLYERKVHNRGIWRLPLANTRAKMYAQDAEITAFLITQVDSLPFVGKALAKMIKYSQSPQLSAEHSHRGKPSIIDLREAAKLVHQLNANGAKDHVARTINLPMPEDRSAIVAGYTHNEKGEGIHQHRVRTIISVLEGQFRVIVWDGKQWMGSVYGPHAFANIDAHTPHLIEPHNPKHPDALNIVMVETLDAVSFKPGDGYNQPIPGWIPAIPQTLMNRVDPTPPPAIALSE